MVRRITYILILLVTVCVMNSCNDDSVLEPSYTFNRPCMDWGASKESVKSYMDGFELQKETSTELHYFGKETELTISYLFNNDELFSTVVMLDGHSDNAELSSSVFRGYNMVDGSSDTFMNEKNETLGYIRSISIDGIDYIMVSWTAIKFSSTEHI